MFNTKKNPHNMYHKRHIYHNFHNAPARRLVVGSIVNMRWIKTYKAVCELHTLSLSLEPSKFMTRRKDNALGMGNLIYFLSVCCRGATNHKFYWIISVWTENYKRRKWQNWDFCQIIAQTEFNLPYESAHILVYASGQSITEEGKKFHSFERKIPQSISKWTDR